MGLGELARGVKDGVRRIAFGSLSPDPDDLLLKLFESENDIERSEDVCFARCFYWEAYKGRPRQKWEARINTLFPRNPAWRADQPADRATTGLIHSRFRDLAEDAHWHFGPWGASPARTIPIPDSPLDEDPTPPAANPLPKPRKRRRSCDWNTISPSELHTAHSNAAPGCACEACLARAGVDEIGPMQVIAPDGSIVDIEPEPAPAADAASPSLRSHASSHALSAASAADERRGSAGRVIRKIRDGVARAHGGPLSIRSSRRSWEGELDAEAKRDDSGYESGG